MGTGRLPTAYYISLRLLPSSEDNYIVLECTCQWCTWRAAILEEMICLLYDVGESSGNCVNVKSQCQSAQTVAISQVCLNWTWYMLQE